MGIFRAFFREVHSVHRFFFSFVNLLKSVPSTQISWVYVYTLFLSPSESCHHSTNISAFQLNNDGAVATTAALKKYDIQK